MGEDAESIGDASMAGEPQENQGLMQANIVRLNHLPFDRDRYEVAQHFKLWMRGVD